jgi:D-glycero-D-manno-heptose 1,7-bisphosphate phosphatase
MSVSAAKNRCVFLDRDGVLNKAIVRDGKPYPPSSPEELELSSDAVAGCERLKQAGFRLVVVTNQPDIGRGKQTREVVDAINQRLAELIPVLDRLEVCGHAGAEHGDPCECRKPKPGMLQRAAAALDIELSASWMIGDRWRDVDCAHAAGCRAVFIDHGYSEPLREKPEFTVANFREAVAVILQNQLPPFASQD